VAWLPRPWSWARAGALNACQLPGSRACASWATRMQGLSGAIVRRPRPPGHVAAWGTGRSVGGMPGAPPAVASWGEVPIACATWRVPSGGAPEEAATKRARPVRGSKSHTQRLPQAPPATQTLWQALSAVGPQLERVLPQAPGGQRRAGPRALCGSVTLGEALQAHLPGLGHEGCACASIPPGLACRVAWLLSLDNGAPSDLLGQSLACVASWLRMARSPTQCHL
jgi:hypothetical protein